MAGPLEVTFAYTQAEVRALARQFPWYRRWEAVLHGALMVFVGMVLASILPAIFQFWIGLAVGWAAMGCLFAVAVVLAFLGRPADTSEFPPLTLRLADDHWESAMGDVEYRNAWNCVQRVAQSDSHLFLFVERWRAFAIPVSAFDARQDFERFAAFVKRHADSADVEQDPQHELQTRFLAVGIDETPPAFQMRFQPTVEELMVYDLHRLNPAQSSVTSGLAAVAVLAALGLFMSFMADSGLGRFLLCAAVALCCTFLVIWGNEFLRRVRWRRDFEPHRLAEVNIAVHTDGVRFQTPLSWGRHLWTAMVNLLENRQFMVLCGVPGVDDLVIPKRALEEGEMAMLRSLVRNGLLAARAEGPPLHVPIDPPTETGNPYQTPTQEA